MSAANSRRRFLHARTCSQVDGVVLSRTPALDGCAFDFFEFHPDEKKVQILQLLLLVWLHNCISC